ncbi:DNA mismatch repair endonuclease MutL [Lactobacillaceae bacterium L1_55_11]|nr:DNA mismatch repair endonuclease MutL [Lactobacillaceae bacterium L1_55_11]
MPKIHELSPLLANQIAAGEVIERPASVVKELVENAIDAGSKHIQIVVAGGGTDLIRVVDDGQGIEADDVPRAFIRHATSKINNRHDLFNIVSLGFRGEALPSIAAVADVTLTTRTAQAKEGLTYHVQGGEVVSETADSSPLGTAVSVRNLFYNTPARLKYLKRPQTELAKIVETVNHLALAHPDIAFRLTNDSRVTFQTTGNGNLQQVLAQLYGRPAAQKMIPVQGENSDFSISGYLSLPELTRSSREYLVVLVNHRYVKNFSISNAVVKGYGSKLMVGRFPVGVIDIELDPLLVDVNVHPQKADIRLAKEDELANLITQSVQASLAGQNLIPGALENLYGQAIPVDDSQLQKTEAELDRTATTEISAVSGKIPAAQRVLPPTTSTIKVTSLADLDGTALEHFQAKYQAEPYQPVFDDDELVADDQADTVAEPAATYQTAKIDQQLDLDLAANHQNQFPALNYIGQMHGTFLFAQSQDSLYLIDQHAAQERINYEHYRKAIGQVSDDEQQMLVPLVLNYPAADILRILDLKDELAAVGIRVEPFGPTTVVVREHPTWMPAGQEQATIQEMIDWLLKDGHLTVAQFREKTAIMMSCKRAIKANMHLSDDQAKALLEKLSHCENPYNCPHGRPVLTSFTLTEMEKMFKRIQDSHESWQNYDNHPY